MRDKCKVNLILVAMVLFLFGTAGARADEMSPVAMPSLERAALRVAEQVSWRVAKRVESFVLSQSLWHLEQAVHAEANSSESTAVQLPAVTARPSAEDLAALKRWRSKMGLIPAEAAEGGGSSERPAFRSDWDVPFFSFGGLLRTE